MPTSRNEKIFITDGTVIGRLTVGPLVRDLKTHPLYIETAQSYIQQGRLREVLCECGVTRLVSESILTTGRVRSCGCLRYEIRMNAKKQGVDNLRKKAEKAKLSLDIQVDQAELRRLQAINVPYRDEKAIDECAARLRKLFARKSMLNRKETHKQVWDNVTKQVMRDKLLEDPDSDSSGA